ncbi:glycoside hydrolase family 5 protein [Aquisalinus flavus]|uniref:Glycoside hydrolase family 5 domain-containing protein n=1 Tax=Aquisalinus flavus TaxID=1526572 RepID=A0A8J2Y597_9PROT|nr:glycoside hydrolase family 5 protein [Aquisalinus flavus]GGC95334.1 hypothetical protein GCM10011342_00180 [Aquisalinus flavus]
MKTLLRGVAVLPLAFAVMAFDDAPPADEDRPAAERPDMTPVETHGQLSVEGNRIVGEHGENVSLAGVSWFWSTIGWGAEKFYNKEAVAYVAEDFDASVVRAAIAAEEKGGYAEYPAEQIAMAQAVIDGAIEAGVYVVIDWHSHSAEDRPEDAVEFFTLMAEQYGDTPNVIYEIYNEPLQDTDWETVIKPYSLEVIEAIRAVDPDNLIVVGTQSWSQDVDEATASPIEGHDNIAYTLHFYAATHGQSLRDKAQIALDNGYALFVTEWGSVDAYGKGAPDHEATQVWVDFLKANELSMANWSLFDKDEGASILKAGASPTGGWTDDDYTEAGLLIREIVRGWDE